MRDLAERRVGGSQQLIAGLEPAEIADPGHSQTGALARGGLGSPAILLIGRALGAERAVPVESGAFDRAPSPARAHVAAV